MSRSKLNPTIAAVGVFARKAGPNAPECPAFRETAIALTIHSIFLGIKFDNDFYKLFRRVILLSFIIFELVAQAYLVATFYSFKEKLQNFINPKILQLKLILVSVLIIVALISVPIISLPGNEFLGFNLKFFKHALEWDYFLGIITFYLLTFLMWKKTSS